MARDIRLERKMADETVCNVTTGEFIQEIRRILYDPVYKDYYPPSLREDLARVAGDSDSSTVQVFVENAAFAAMCLLRRKNGLQEPVGDPEGCSSELDTLRHLLGNFKASGDPCHLEKARDSLNSLIERQAVARG